MSSRTESKPDLVDTAITGGVIHGEYGSLPMARRVSQEAIKVAGHHTTHLARLDALVGRALQKEILDPNQAPRR